jgi:hypothetical protein
VRLGEFIGRLKNEEEKQSLESEVVPNQVFIGCPARIIRAKYRSVINKLKILFVGLSFIYNRSTIGQERKAPKPEE